MMIFFLFALLLGINDFDNEYVYYDVVCLSVCLRVFFPSSVVFLFLFCHFGVACVVLAVLLPIIVRFAGSVLVDTNPS